MCFLSNMTLTLNRVQIWKMEIAIYLVWQEEIHLMQEFDAI